MIFTTNFQYTSRPKRLYYMSLIGAAEQYGNMSQISVLSSTFADRGNEPDDCSLQRCHFSHFAGWKYDTRYVSMGLVFKFPSFDRTGGSVL